MRTYVYTPAPVEAIQWREGDGTVLNLSGRVVEVQDTDYLTRDEYGDVRVIPAAWFEAHYKEVQEEPATDLPPIAPIPATPPGGVPDAHPDAHPPTTTEAPAAEAPSSPWPQTTVDTATTATPPASSPGGGLPPTTPPPQTQG